MARTWWRYYFFKVPKASFLYPEIMPKYHFPRCHTDKSHAEQRHIYISTWGGLLWRKATHFTSGPHTTLCHILPILCLLCKHKPYRYKEREREIEKSHTFYTASSHKGHATQCTFYICIAHYTWHVSHRVASSLEIKRKRHPAPFTEKSQRQQHYAGFRRECCLGSTQHRKRNSSTVREGGRGLNELGLNQLRAQWFRGMFLSLYSLGVCVLCFEENGKG